MSAIMCIIKELKLQELLAKLKTYFRFTASLQNLILCSKTKVVLMID